jgi:O-antigen ligase
MKVHTLAACVAALFLAACVFGHTVALRLLLLGSGIVLTSVAIKTHRGEIRVLPPIWLPFVLLAAWAALSMSWSVEPARSLKEWRNEFFYTGAALWICFVGAQAANAVRIFPSVMAAAAVIASAIAIGDYSYGFDFYAIGWHGGQGDHSSALVTILPCAVLAGWYAHRANWPLRASIAIWALVALLIVSAYLTHNRMVWIAFAAQCVLLCAWIASRMPSSVPRGASSKLTVAILAVGAVVASGTVILTVQAEREAFGVQFLHRDTRLQLWPKVFEHISERPLTGYGVGRGILRDPLQQEFRNLDNNLWHAHNIFLDTLLQLGLPGLLLFLTLLGAILREGWRLARATDELTAALGIALLCVVAGILVRNMADTLLVRQNALLFWGVVGVLLAWGTRSWRASS